ncbi:MAG TPA: serine hydrolase domain-containing protein [Pirellulales bacterium]|jgi:D-alanyl-D-alanine carboxypeptidase|nr:serine hydrolase domain-containing protein [Pirellulales bacterium]
MHWRRLSIPLTVALIAAGSLLQVARSDEIDDYVNTEMQTRHIPGVSLAVIKEGKVVKAQGYGLANVELKVPAGPETVYKIGSVSKQFIAAGIMLLVQDGKIKVDDKISTFLQGTPEAWKDITIRHLLTHTSGLSREAPGFASLKVQSEAEVIKTAYDQKLVFAPGEKWQYCNLGYFALAEIMRRASGKPWDQFMRERVFAPLGMDSTRVTTVRDIVPNRADGYYWRGHLENDEVMLAVRPSGAFLSSVLDLAKWEAALDGHTVLTPASLDEMWTAVTLSDGKQHPYGYGWELAPIGGRRVVRHGGTLTGFRSSYLRLVDDKVSVIVLANGAAALPGVMAIKVARHYVPELPPEQAASAN